MRKIIVFVLLVLAAVVLTSCTQNTGMLGQKLYAGEIKPVDIIYKQTYASSDPNYGGCYMWKGAHMGELTNYNFVELETTKSNFVATKKTLPRGPGSVIYDPTYKMRFVLYAVQYGEKQKWKCEIYYLKEHPKYGGGPGGWWHWPYYGTNDVANCEDWGSIGTFVYNPSNGKCELNSDQVRCK